MKDQRLICIHCYRWYNGPTSLGFLGHPKFACPWCHRTNRYPLSTGRTVAYSIFIGLAVLGSVHWIIKGGVPILGVIPILMIIAIVESSSIKLKVNQARRRADAILAHQAAAAAAKEQAPPPPPGTA